MNLTAEIFERQKTKEKIHKAQLGNSSKPVKVALLSKPVVRLGQICKRIEEMKAKNLKCLRTLAKYELSPSTEIWKSAFVKIDTTHAKVRSISASKRPPTEFRRPKSATAYFREGALNLHRDSKEALPKQELRPGARPNIVALNQNLKRLLRKSNKPPTFEQIKEKATLLSSAKGRRDLQAASSCIPGNSLVHKFSHGYNRDRDLDLHAVDKSLSYMSKTQLLCLKQAIDSKIRAFAEPKETDSDSTFEVRLAEVSSLVVLPQSSLEIASPIAIEDLKNPLIPKGRLKLLEESIPVGGEELRTASFREASLLESQSEAAIKEHLQKRYAGWLN